MARARICQSNTHNLESTLYKSESTSTIYLSFMCISIKLIIKQGSKSDILYKVHLCTIWIKYVDMYSTSKAFS